MRRVKTRDISNPIAVQEAALHGKRGIPRTAPLCPEGSASASPSRALLKDAPVILLDEATASLDPENETLIQRAVGALCAGKTVIVIAHRLRTIANADKIVVLDDGNIVEEGTHDDLVSRNGLYQHLWDLQLQSSSWGADGRMSAEGA